jgi:hypothetical protein
MGAYGWTISSRLRGAPDVWLDVFCFRAGRLKLAYTVNYDVRPYRRARRILFGSDFGILRLGGGGGWLCGSIGESFYRKVFHENARDLMARLGC